jgi:hypothetical protein
VPPVPEDGSVEVLNLAFERISILDQLSKSAETASELRIKKVKPDAFASAVSVSSPVRFPVSSGGSGPSAVVVAIGLLVASALLAAGGFLLALRSRRAASP